MRFPTMWLGALALAACGAPTPNEGDRCDDGAKPLCQSATARLVCNGTWSMERCRGPAGCASAAAGATCDQSVVVAGDRCNPAADTTACQADPAAVMDCSAVWTAKKSCAAGCVQTDGGAACAAVDGGEPVDAGPLYPIVQKGSGPVMVNPRWVSVTFSNDTPDMVRAADDFVATLGATSNFWTPLAMEYGLGVPTAAPPVHLAEAAPASITDVEIESWLQVKVATTAGLVGADSNTLVILFYPETTAIGGRGGGGCSTYLGYHSTLGGGSRVPYAVIARCPQQGLTALQVLTTTVTHEAFEAATDPQPGADSAYTGLDDDHLVYGWLSQGELGDMCDIQPGVNYTPAGYGYMVERMWSNAAASSGRDPCQPELPGETYVQAVPIFYDLVSFRNATESGVTRGVMIPIGQSKTLEVKLAAEATLTGPMVVSASSLGLEYPGAGALTFAWDASHGVPGDTLHLTITAVSPGPAFGGEPFRIRATYGGLHHDVFGFVTNN